MPYLLVTFGLFVVFAVIVWRVCRKDRREELEAPKNRMLDDD